jgi:hypothetical protein
MIVLTFKRRGSSRAAIELVVTVAQPEQQNGDQRLDHRSGENMIVSWRSVAFSAILVAVGALGSLVLVVTTGNADALSTIALALAIIAFVIQIMVFIAHTWAASWTGVPQFGQKRSSTANSRPQFLQYLSATTPRP